MDSILCLKSIGPCLFYRAGLNPSIAKSFYKNCGKTLSELLPDIPSFLVAFVLL